MSERITQDETLWDGHVGLRRLTIERAQAGGASDALIREVTVLPQSAVILLRRHDDGRLILTRQFRAPLLFNQQPAMLIECCAGNVDTDPSPEQALAAAEQTARREAEEETGWRVETARHLFSLYMSPGVSNEIVHFFVGLCRERVGTGGGLAEEGEEIETLELSLEEAATMLADGQIQDAKTVVLVQHLLLQRALGDAAPPASPIA